MRMHCWWTDRRRFVREGHLEETDDGVILVAEDGTVLTPEDMEGIRIHRLGTSEPIRELRDAARRAGYDVVDR